MEINASCAPKVIPMVIIQVRPVSCATLLVRLVTVQHILNALVVIIPFHIISVPKIPVNHARSENTEMIILYLALTVLIIVNIAMDRYLIIAYNVMQFILTEIL